MTFGNDQDQADPSRAMDEFHRLIGEIWIDKLTLSELRLLRWVAQMLLPRGRTSGHFYEKQILGGVRDRVTRKLLCEGAGISRPSMFRALNSLQAKGLLTHHHSNKGCWSAGWHFELHLDARP